MQQNSIITAAPRPGIALLCPGQGSQYIGMGRELSLAFPQAREVFAEVDEAISFKLSNLMFAGDIEDLTATHNTQPALLATAVAAWRCLAAALGVGKAGELAVAAAGHSLGEYSALCLAGSFDLTLAAKLVRQRGLAMRDAVPEGVGGMVALLGVDIATAAQLAADSGCEVANDNGAGQVVVSGTNTALAALQEMATERGVKKAIRLQVGAPFHSSLMMPAAVTMAAELADKGVVAAEIPVISNYRAKAHGAASSEIKGDLVAQITGSVRWAETMKTLVEDYNCGTVIELGAGKVLGNLAKRMFPDLQIYTVQTPGDVDQLLGEIKVA